MIRNETEYQEAALRLREEHKRHKAYRVQLKESGLETAEIKRAMDPLLSFSLQLEEEIESYERLKRSKVDQASIEMCSDKARYQTYVETGESIDNQNMMDWLDKLANQKS